MGRLNELAQNAVSTVEQADSLDRVSAPLQTVVKKLTGNPAVKNVLSGTWLGHSLHPVLTDLPIGAWVSATVVDLAGGEQGAAAARRLVGIGVLAAAPTAAAGASDWSDTHGPAQRAGLIHWAGNFTATVLQGTSWMLRRRGHRGAGATLSLLALGITVGAAYLGGHLTLRRGIGVNHTAFQDDVTEWTDVAADADLQEAKPIRVEASGVPVMLVRTGGAVRALSATCTHAGGPLDEGTIDDGCVTCPWHGSRFDLADGSVVRGPASAPEPVWDVKVENDRVWVRSTEPRS
ncbi:MAG TPA: Rieske 2Fe-2S domain-containing protein [Microbacterium sp.]|uniref:Rieske 2Fe-2S domain-containing protein n=1 Tax=Microbacterium sp. TaxID=51671 RepID=UPI002B4A9609|nr:Rieske 2Fe-2S domain-containing protein [Microbacterium sp.]HKT58192.1 Rieske 2Fe-2S domain-containing protein [Microbacterium sp.]